MIRLRRWAVALTVLFVSAAGGAAIVGAQEDLVTLTVSVSTPSGDPVRGATLTATWDGGSTSRTTVSSGNALIDVPAGADVEIRVEHDDYVRNFPVEVEDASVRDVSMTVYLKASARVTVEDASGPVPDAEVVLRKRGRDVVRETTDDRGVVESSTIEAGTYTVVVSKAGYFVEQRTADVSGGSAVEITIRRGTVNLEVNVTDDHFDPPRAVGDASVEVTGSGSVTTQPGGIGRISVPVNTWAYLEVTKDGYRTTEESVFVAEENAHVDLSIQRIPSISVELLSERVVIGESVSLSVTDEYGDPVPSATVRLDGEAVAETGEDGRAVIEIGSAGEHVVVVEKGSLTTASRTVVGVHAGEDGDSTPAAAGAGDSTETVSGNETAVEVPGFDFLAGVLALLVVATLARYRR